MIQTVFYLIYIQWRKNFAKDDFFSLIIFSAVFLCLLIGIFQTYQENYYLLFLFLLIPTSHHFGRNDFSLLKHSSIWRLLIFLEYSFILLPILAIFSIKQDFLYILILFLLLVTLVFLPQKKLKINYPFCLFDPFWVISFRKYKLGYLLLFSLFLITVGKIYNNENIVFFSTLLLGLVATIPYFEREFLVHIIFSKFKKEKYLFQQLICCLKNFFTLLSFFSILIFVLFSWKLALFSFLVVIFPLLGVLTKYVFFEKIFSQSIIFSLILAGYSFALPLICLPILYYQAIKNIKKLQDVTN